MNEKKPGFLKRVFSFGRKSGPVPEAAPEEKAPLEQVPLPEVQAQEPTHEKELAIESEAPSELLTKPEDATAPPPSSEVLSSDEKPAEVDVVIAEHDASAYPTETAEPVAETPPQQSWLGRLTSGLSRSSSSLTNSLTAVFTKRKLDDETLQDLEDVLIQADLGVETAMSITERLSEGRFGKDISPEEIKDILADEVAKVLEPVARPLELDFSNAPHVILVVGVNGTGKTTTIGKLAAKLTREGASVMLAAGDTFRAAAVEQLKIWGERTGSDVISRDIGADAAGLAYDAYEAARAKNVDVLLVDTAGRLQNKAELMAELEKVIRVIKKQNPDAPHTVLLTLDATTGQNALQQVEIFGEKAGVSGLVMTKLDGTARGGILVAIAAKHGLPVHFIGIGEGIDDLEPFEARDFGRAIAGLS